METLLFKHHRVTLTVLFKAAMALVITISPLCLPTAGAAEKSTAVLTSASGAKIPLVSFSDSFTPPGKVAGQKVVNMGLLTVKYRLSQGGRDPFKAEIAGKRIKTLRISILNAGQNTGIAYTFSNDMVASVRISGKGDQAYVTVVFAYSKVSATGAPAGKTHPDAWVRGL